MNITVIGNNPKLPNVYITKAILENDSISVTLSIEEGSESGVNNFSNLNYFKYLKFNVSISFGDVGAATELQIDEIPKTTTVNFIDIDTTGLLSVDVETYFDSTQYIVDNNIVDTNLYSLVIATLGGSVRLAYPVLDFNGELILQLTDVDGTTVQSIVSDYRSITSLENLNFVKSPSVQEERPIYFNFLVSDVVGSKVNNFVSFNYKKFLRNNSYFSSDNFDDFSMQINISNSLKNLENIVINANGFFTKSQNTKLISKSDEIILFYFEDTNVLDVDEYVTSYKLNVSYVDKTYSKFYNGFEQTGSYYDVYNQYVQFKNKVFLAQKYSDYPYNPNIKQPFYLDLSTDRFTNEFVSFCERTGINLSSLINNLVNVVINPFLNSDQQITQVTIDKIVSSLQFDVSTYTLYTSFFKTVDNIFSQIKNNYLIKSKATTTIYNKNYPIKEKVNSSFFLIDDINNDGIPKLQLDKMRNIINRYDSKSNTVRPKSISNNKEKNEILDSLEFDSTTFNHISSFTKALQDNKKLNLSTQLITEDSYLQKLGVTLTVGYLESPNVFTPSNKTETFRTSPSSTPKKGLKSNNLTLQDISKADVNLKSKIKQTNQFSHALNFGKFKEKVTKEEVTPKLYLFYYNEQVDGYWSRLTKFTTITKNMLIKIEKDLEDETIFTKAGVPIIKVPLENNYFILE